MVYLIKKGTILKKDCYNFLRALKKDGGEIKYKCYDKFTELNISPIHNVTGQYLSCSILDYVRFTNFPYSLVPVPNRTTSSCKEAATFLVNYNKSKDLLFPEISCFPGLFKCISQYFPNCKIILDKN